MIWGALVGAGASLLGGALNQPSGGGYRFRPGSYSGPTGSSSIDRDGDVRTYESAFNSGARGAFQDYFNQFAADPTNSYQFGTNLLNQGQGMFGDVFGGAMNAGYDFSNAQTMDYLNQMGGLSDTFGTVGQAGINAAFDAPSAMGLANAAGGFGMGLMGQTDLNALASQYTDQLNTLAGPAEATAANQKFQGLFNRGMLGTSGGAQQIGQLQQAQQSAAAERGLMGMNFADQVRNANLQNAQGFMGLGLQGIGQDQAHSQFLGQLGAGMYQAMPGIYGQMLGAGVGMDERNVNRAQERLASLEGMFGFARQQQEGPVASMSRTLAGMAPLDANALALGQQAIDAARVRSGNQGAGGGSALGAGLQGLGSGLFSSWANNFFQSQPASQNPAG